MAIPRPGKCRACGCTEERACMGVYSGACCWSDKTRTHCSACFCRNCGKKFLTSNDYTYDAVRSRVCRAAGDCAKRFAKRQLVNCGRAADGSAVMNGKAWTEADQSYIYEHYSNERTATIAAQLGRSESNVYAKATRLGLRKSAEFLSDPSKSGRIFKGSHDGRGVGNRFVKGQRPANKGLRRPGWAPGRMRETQFRKGERSGVAAKNWVPIGTILTDFDGYQRIKIREAEYGKEATGFGNTKVWPMYNRHLWEQHYGPIPPKHMVIFKDGNRANCSIENLELISMADNARRNTMWNRFPPELIGAINANAALKRKLRKLDGAK